MTIEQQAGVVYESPDGGQTIYARKSGESGRTLVYESLEIRSIRRWQQLKKIVELAESDITLNDQLSKLEMLYALKKAEGST
jgi:hypothetical protein